MATGKQKRGFTKTADSTSASDDVPAKRQKLEVNPKTKEKPTKAGKGKGVGSKNGVAKKVGKFGAKPMGKTFKKGEKAKAKPDILSNKEAHSKGKSLRIERRQKDRSHYDTTVEMKQIWEDLRRHDLPKEQRVVLCDKIMTLVRGKERDFAFAHDTSRIFQTLCKYAPPNVRSEVFANLKDSILDMTKSKYSMFFVRSLLRRGTKEEKNYIIEHLMSNARKLLTHKIAGPVVEFAYNEYANARQRLAFSQQFYGPSFTLLKMEQHLPLAKVLEEKPEKKTVILKHMSESLESIVQKEALSFSFVHNLFYEYFTFAEKLDKQAMAECLQEHIAHIVHTREGAKAAMYTVWYSSSKGRKVIVKQLKPFLATLFKEEYGHLVLCAIFDSVDDTKLVQKLIVSEIAEKLEELVEDKWARHVLIYLLNPRDPSHFNKEIREFLAIGDGNPFSKKDTDLRQRELRDEISPALITYAAGKIKSFLINNQLMLLLGIILSHASTDKSELIDSLAQLVSEDESLLLTNKTLRFIIMRLLKNDTEGAVAAKLAEAVEVKLASYVADETGCFLLANILKGYKDAGLKSKLVAKISKKKASMPCGKDNKAKAQLMEALKSG